MLRLALTGGLYSGKTTLANALVERSGFSKIDYTGLLKTYAVQALEAVGVNLEVADIEADKEKYRSFLIELGHLKDFDSGAVIPEIIADLDPKRSYVFDNVRFDAQYEKLQDAGFILVRLTTPMRFRVARAMAQGIGRVEFARRTMDSSEEPLSDFPNEVRLHVDGDIAAVIDDLTAKVLNSGFERKKAEDAAARQAAAESTEDSPVAEELPVVVASGAESGS